jgi:DNA-binding PadR family transcriptional regulator
MDYGAVYNAQFIMNNAQYKKTKTPFRESNRFYRGRIMNLLREKSMKERDVLDIMKEVYMKEKECIMPILQKLEKDGLIVRTKTGIITLPE